MNNVQLLGRMVKNPEMRFAANTGKAITRFTLAVQDEFKKDECDFLNCVAFGKTGEIIAEHFTKGSRILIKNGRIKTGSYEDKNGVKKYTTDIIIDKIEFVDIKPKSDKKEDPDFSEVKDDGDMSF